MKKCEEFTESRKDKIKFQTNLHLKYLIYTLLLVTQNNNELLQQRQNKKHISEMRGFSDEEKGLFTFYRQQQQIEKSLKQEIRLKQKKKKVSPIILEEKDEELKIKKKSKDQSRKQQKHISKINFIPKLKEESTILQKIEEQKKMYMPRPLRSVTIASSHEQEQEPEQIFHSIQFKKKFSKQRYLPVNSEFTEKEIFIKKKNYKNRTPLDRKPIKIRQISSVGLLSPEDEIILRSIKTQKSTINYNTPSLKGNYSIKREKSIFPAPKKKSHEKLPKISQSLSKNYYMNQLLHSRKQKNDFISNYRSKQIIFNNRRFQISPQNIKSKLLTIAPASSRAISPQKITPQKKESFLVSLINKHKFNQIKKL